MLPSYEDTGLDNGIGQVIYHYHQYLPKVGIEVVTKSDSTYSVSASHLGRIVNADIMFSHGFWFNQISDLQAQQNAQLVESIRYAKAVVVPSNYVAETFRRDFRLNPFIINHGVEMSDWKGAKNKGYVLWNKNRPGDVCSPIAVYELAKRNPDVQFITTFYPKDKEPLTNVQVTGKLSFNAMKELIKGASIYLATAKETFNISALEHLACGIPVLGFNWGGTADIITNKQDGYLVNPNDYEALSEGLEWLLTNRSKLTKNCKDKASSYNWLDVAKKIKEICEYVQSY